MSSLNCRDCQYRLWDKYTGLSKGVKEKKDSTYCPKCKEWKSSNYLWGIRKVEGDEQ